MLAQPGWLMRILGPIVLSLVLAVLNTRHDFSSRSTVAPQLVCDDHSRDIPQSFQELAEEFLSRLLISAALDQDIQHIAILIHCTPEVMETTIDLEEHLVEMPSIAGSRRSAAQAVGVSLTELEAPFSDSLIAERQTAHR